MGTNKVNTAIGYKIQMARIPFVNKHFALGALMFKVSFLPTPVKGHVIYINTDNITIEAYGRRPVVCPLHLGSQCANQLYGDIRPTPFDNRHG